MIKKVAAKIFETFPFFEIIIRHIYWRNKYINKIVDTILKKISYEKTTNDAIIKNGNFSAVVDEIIKLGVSEGDILIVHSAYASLKHFNLSPNEIIFALKNIVGEKGTLVMPSIPIFRNEPAPINRFDDRFYDNAFLFDINSKRIWTGVLPLTLMKTEGAVRSKFPLNNIVALGFEADEITSNNLNYEGQTACGESSSWAYCYKKNAKILMLGVDTVHSLTMIHVAEDLFESDWPIKNWYRNRVFHVKDEDFNKSITIRERHPKWALFYAEKRFSSDLVKSSIVVSKNIQNLNFTVCQSINLINFLKSHKETSYPYYIPFFMNIKKNVKNQI